MLSARAPGKIFKFRDVAMGHIFEGRSVLQLCRTYIGATVGAGEAEEPHLDAIDVMRRGFRQSFSWGCRP